MEDDINYKIYKLVQSINHKLTNTGEMISFLEQETEKLAPKDELSEFLDTYQNSEIQPNDLEIIIHNLETQRIQLVMDIQQQDYIRDKLQQLINHNAEMVLSVKEYLENRPELLKEDYGVLNTRYKSYVSQAKKQIAKLQFNNYEMKKSLNLILDKLSVIELKDIPQINELINVLNSRNSQDIND